MQSSKKSIQIDEHAWPHTFSKLTAVICGVGFTFS